MLKPGDIFASVIRTGVPFLVGVLLSLPVASGLNIDADVATGAVTFLVTTAYYLVFRFAETHLDSRWGWFLGLAKPPAYDA